MHPSMPPIQRWIQMINLIDRIFVPSLPCQLGVKKKCSSICAEDNICQLGQILILINPH